MIWRIVVRLIGGFYEWRKLAIVIHDNGIDVAWSRVLKWEWRA